MSGKARTWEDIRADMLARGQITEDGIAQARTEQDAFETGYHLAELRKQTGMTQKDVAEVLDVTQARVSALENGDLNSLTLGSVRKYLAAIGGSFRLVAAVDDTEVTLRMPVGVGTGSAEAALPSQAPLK